VDNDDSAAGVEKNKLRVYKKKQFQNPMAACRTMCMATTCSGLISGAKRTPEGAGLIGMIIAYH